MGDGCICDDSRKVDGKVSRHSRRERDIGDDNKHGLDTKQMVGKV